MCRAQRRDGLGLRELAARSRGLRSLTLVRRLLKCAFGVPGWHRRLELGDGHHTFGAAKAPRRWFCFTAGGSCRGSGPIWSARPSATDARPRPLVVRGQRRRGGVSSENQVAAIRALLESVGEPVHVAGICMAASSAT